jgi:signal recognition particle subunit SRP54
MFDELGDKLSGVFRKLRGEARISEENIRDAVREVRLALLDADVNLKVVKQFIGAVREKALGEEVLKSIKPGQQFIKVVHDELVSMMGGEAASFELKKGHLNTILLLGLQGSGKTTFSGKLALRYKSLGFNPLLVACDIHRPAAVQQLQVVGRNLEVPVFDRGTGTPAPEVARAGLDHAKRNGSDLVIFDTAGRLHIDEVRMEELQEIKATVNPYFSFFVADAMTGSDAVNSARSFHEGVGIDGVCLTKLDGDARGGAALSIRAITGKPIYFVGLGEKSEDLEPFHPDRMASRILGMGDVLTLVEKAQEQIDQDQAEEMQKKLRKQTFSLQDFLDQMKQVKKMGSIKSLMNMIPGMRDMMKEVGDDIKDDMMKPMEAMILSMTLVERENPEIIDGSRRKRISSGSGTTPADLNGMLKEFFQMRKMMGQMMRMGGMGGVMKKGVGELLQGKGGSGDEEVAAKIAAGGIPRGAFNQRAGRSAGDPFAEKQKPKHRRKSKSRKDKAKRKRNRR